jgi:sugar/nucleoside kinase (ribokinase family)
LLTPERIDCSSLDVDILHIGYILLLDGLDAPDLEYKTALCRVLSEARAMGIETSIDVVTEDGARFAALVPPALAYADYCIINEMEAEYTTGIRLRGENGQIIKENLRHASEKLIAMGVSRWAVIHMPELSCGASTDGAYVLRESWKIPPDAIKSSVGAGDAFAVGILYGAYKGWSLARSIDTAGAIAAWSLSGSGAADAIVPLEALLFEMERFR